MLNLGSSFYLFEFLIVTVALACVDAALAFIAFFQLTRIQFRTWQLGWTRQKVLHLMIGSSNLGYFLYFILTPIATCNGWLWWSNACGFFFMAFPEILFLAAFLLLLSFWVDLCHQANDEEDEDEDEENCSQQPLLESSKGKPNLSHVDYRWRCCSFCGIHIGSRQKFVIVVVVMAFILMALFAVLIWIGAGKNPIDSSIVAQVYVKLFAAAILLLGLALGSYGLLLFLKLRGVTYENASSEMWKIAGLAVISVICFTSSSLLALLTEVPLFYCWNLKKLQETKTTFLLVVYYFLGIHTTSIIEAPFLKWHIQSSCDIKIMVYKVIVQNKKIFYHNLLMQLSRQSFLSGGLKEIEGYHLPKNLDVIANVMHIFRFGKVTKHEKGLKAAMLLAMNVLSLLGIRFSMDGQ